MYDPGSNTSLITKALARLLNLPARKVGCWVTIATKEEEFIMTNAYELTFPIVTDGKEWTKTVTFYEVPEEITSAPSKIDVTPAYDLFKHVPRGSLDRPSNRIGLLLGMDCADIMPTPDPQGKSRVGNLVCMNTVLGGPGHVLGGSHPLLTSENVSYEPNINTYKTAKIHHAAPDVAVNSVNILQTHDAEVLADVKHNLPAQVQAKVQGNPQVKSQVKPSLFRASSWIGDILHAGGSLGTMVDGPAPTDQTQQALRSCPRDLRPPGNGRDGLATALGEAETQTHECIPDDHGGDNHGSTQGQDQVDVRSGCISLDVLDQSLARSKLPVSNYSIQDAHHDASLPQHCSALAPLVRQNAMAPSGSPGAKLQDVQEVPTEPTRPTLGGTKEMFWDKDGPDNEKDSSFDLKFEICYKTIVLCIYTLPILLIIVTSDRFPPKDYTMGRRKDHLPPKFSAGGHIHGHLMDFEEYRSKLIWCIEHQTDYTMSEMASLIALELPNSDDQGNLRDKCFQEIGDCFLGKRPLMKLIEWLDTKFFPSGWRMWMNKARQDPDCYVSYWPMPPIKMEWKMYPKWTAHKDNIRRMVMTICPEDEEPFDSYLKAKKKWKAYKPNIVPLISSEGEYTGTTYDAGEPIQGLVYYPHTKKLKVLKSG